ncbi:hypothetical protein CQ393_12140 [Stenotrophomonas sp. MYb238]|uniref:hypothetical protein n=1 Tax=Stenotrophomonas sp. MYb238 TaxID=2040281 RepID=UPI0012918C20|nr:hypothetical protein [Stenotrophomonas sp. MYb238]MQP76640.1 hypothetical protein [Stenotrophomonas sp. MYb238]
MVFILLVAAFLANVAYLSLFYVLMDVIEKSAPVYWMEIGRPRSFSGRDVSSVLNNLYTRRMGKEIGKGNLNILISVRVLLPLAVILSIIAIVVLSKIL